jgi:hypothetical protein
MALQSAMPRIPIWQLASQQMRSRLRFGLSVRRPTLSVALFVGLAVSPGFAAESIATNSPNGVPLSLRVVAYTIDAKLDTTAKTLDATETLDYKNLTGQPLDSFPFHLYLNAFRPESTFSYEAHAHGSVRAVENSYPAEKIGGIEIKAISADGFGDLSKSWQFIAPDDGNSADHTVMLVKLARPLAPNDTIRFHIAFHDKFPISIARNGWKRDFIMGGQWFPKEEHRPAGRVELPPVPFDDRVLRGLRDLRREAECAEALHRRGERCANRRRAKGRRDEDAEFPWGRHSRLRLGGVAELRSDRPDLSVFDGAGQAACAGIEGSLRADAALSRHPGALDAKVRRVVWTVPI